MYHFLTLLSVGGHLGCLHFLATLSSAAVNLRMHLSLSKPMLFPLHLYPEVGLLNQVVVLVLILRESIHDVFYKLCIRAPFFRHPHQHLFSLWITANLSSVSCFNLHFPENSCC